MSVDLKSLWDQTLDILQNELNQTSFDTWLKSTSLTSFEKNKITVLVPNEYAQHWLEDRYYNLIKNTLGLLLNQDVDVSFVTPESHNGWGKTFLEDPLNRPNRIPTPVIDSKLNPKYTFETFVIGEGNRLAHAAALAVAGDPAGVYNPLFLYGGVGLGKTHLMHAIGHYVLEHKPEHRVVYVSSEKFTNELINSIKDGKTAKFRSKYRSIDVLLVDDIQFLVGKERTQEEFFHTFNALYDANKQIIISSDRPPKEILHLEDRLRSRFEWGLITDIQPPDYETRLAILRKKAQTENMMLSDDVLVFIASKIDSNIRKLEGALLKVAAYASITDSEVGATYAEEILKDILPHSEPRPITIDIIQEKVASYYKIKKDDLKAKRRTRSVVYPRQIAMYLSREMTDCSLPVIGETFGGRDHTTVMHACEKISQQININPTTKYDVDSIRAMIING